MPVRIIIYLLFFFSGFTSLIYETIFVKCLTFVFGCTAYATSTVLASFMGGLAVGSYFLGRFADRIKNPLLAYGIVELIIGIYSVCVPWILDLLLPVYKTIYSASSGELIFVTIAQFLLCGIVIFIPTFLMGGTLPIVSKAVVRNENEIGTDVGTLYSINTFGAAAGVLLGSYFFIYNLGIQKTLFATSCFNIVIFLAAAGLRNSLKIQKPDDAGHVQDKGRIFSGFFRDGRTIVILIAAFFSGFNTLSYEVLWTHLLAVEIGTSVYAFGIMLFTFLLGLASGSSFAARISRSESIVLWAIGISQCLLGIIVIILLPFWDDLPSLFAKFGKYDPSFVQAELFRGAVAFSMMIIPAFLMGMTFPLVIKIMTKEITFLGTDIGTIYFINTIGSIAGSVISGFVVLNFLGSEKGIAFYAVLSTVIGFILLMTLPGIKLPARFSVSAAGMIIFAILFVVKPQWDILKLTRGTNVYFSEGTIPDELVASHEDIHGGITTVTRKGNVRTLWTNGKFQGDDYGELNVQRGMATVSALLMKDSEKVLVIGLGTGCTAGTLLKFPVKNMEIAEISPGIVELSRKYFSGINENVVDDKRVTIHLVDGRNFLLLTDQQYDAIVIELTSVWFANAGNLYNREFYELAAAHLKPEGIIQQWIQLHHIMPEDIMVAINTMRDVFPHVTFFQADMQGLIIGSKSPVTIDAGRVKNLEKQKDVRHLLRSMGKKTMLEFAANLIFDEQSINEMKNSQPDIVSTDDNLLIEYSTPKGNFLKAERRENLDVLLQFQKDSLIPVINMPEGFEQSITDEIAGYFSKRIVR